MSLGDGSLNLPYEPVPDGPLNIPLDVAYASGVVVLAAYLPIPEKGKDYPALIFRFSRGDGTFMDDICLVVEKDELAALKTLIAKSVDAVLKVVP